jgi:hypothetical protein
MKNITLSADETLIALARQYAQARNTTLNELIRDYLSRITGRMDGSEAAKAFTEVARCRSGRSEDGWAWDRDAIHQRKGHQRRGTS